MQELSDKKDCKAKTAIKNLQKDHSAKVLELRDAIKQKDQMITELQDMAFEVSTEYSNLAIRAEKDKRKQTKVEKSLMLTAKNRLQHAKEAKEREKDVRQSFDSMKDSYSEVSFKLSSALSEIDFLKQQLQDSQKELTVSLMHCSLSHTSL